VGHSVPEVVTGKPVVLGGSPGRKEATGRGVVYMIEEAAAQLQLDLTKATAVIQGFGNVGLHVARFLALLGVKVIAVSDVSTGLYHPEGLDIADLEKFVAVNKCLKNYPRAEAISNKELLETPCDILIPAALGGQITEQNADRIQCRILAEGANGPTTLEADEILGEKGVFIIPDILANAGGVTASYFEWVQGTQNYMWSLKKINRNLRSLMIDAYHRVYQRQRREKIDSRTAALIEGIQRIVQAELTAGLFP
jgi:glutamate dehydrogenase (NAD(P)+)